MTIGIYLSLSLLLFMVQRLTSGFTEDMRRQNQTVASLLRSAEMPEAQVVAVTTGFEGVVSHVSNLVRSSVTSLAVCALVGFVSTDYRLGELERQIRSHTPAIKAQASA